MQNVTHQSLQAEGLSCVREGRILFEGLNFHLKNGQILLLEGKNGSGKTSLLRIICGLREQDEGKIRWCNEPVNNSAYYNEMAYVGHLNGIKQELTVAQNLKITQALGKAGRYSTIQALAKLTLAGYQNTLVQSLSAGQQRRLSLARLLITQKSLWVLDEPFTSLDTNGIKQIKSLIQEHVDHNGLVVLASHHVLELAPLVTQTINLSMCETP